MKTRKNIGYNEIPRISRRESLKWFGLLLAGGAVTPYPADAGARPQSPGHAASWPDRKLPAVGAAGYGQDPDLVSLTSGPWPRTLSDAELHTIRLVAGILVPAEGGVPSAADLHIEDVVDEWLSAPYEGQQRDRALIVPLLQWLDDESRLRFGRSFSAINEGMRLTIVEDIAWREAADEYRKPAAAFDRLRSIVVAAFYCTPAGSADLGYLGNTVIAGDYPGPTDEALRHLHDVLDSLGLDEVTDPGLPVFRTDA